MTITKVDAIFNVTLVFAILAFIKYVLGFSFVKVIDELAKLYRLDPSLKAINGAGVLASILVSIIFFAAPTLGKVLSAQAGSSASGQTATNFVATICAIFLPTALCIRMCR